MKKTKLKRLTESWTSKIKKDCIILRIEPLKLIRYPPEPYGVYAPSQQ